MRRILQIITLGALAVVGTAGARADDAAVAPDLSALIDVGALQQEEAVFDEASVVVGAARYAQKTGEAPATVTILTAEQIRRYGWRTLGEALGAVPGLYVSNDRRFATLGIRGVIGSDDRNTRVLVLLDGHRLNDNIFGGAGIDRSFPLDLADVRRIEVIRGPGSTNYGTSAVLAVVNVITRDAVDGFEMGGVVGSHGRLERRISAGGTEERSSWTASYTSFDAPGDPTDFPELAGVGMATSGEVDGERGHHGYAKVRAGDLTLEAFATRRDKQYPGALFGATFPDPRTRGDDRQEALWATWERETAPGTNVMARFSVNRLTYDITLGQSVAYGGLDVFSGAEGTWMGLESQVTRTTKDGHRLSYGAEYRRAGRQYGYIRPVLLPTDPGFVSVAEDLWAVFLSDEYRLRPDLLLSSGLRYDRYETFGSATSPRLALIHEARRDTTVKLMWGQAFRAPGLYERTLGPGGFQGNDAVQPEELDSLELRWIRALSPRSELSAGLFSNEIDDQIVQLPDRSYANAVSSRARGAELEYVHRAGEGRELRLGYTYQRATDRASGAVLVDSPRHLGKVNWMCPVSGTALTMGAGLRLAGERLSRSGAELGSVAVTDVTLSGGKGDVTYGLGIYNLFDRRYEDPVSAPYFFVDTMPQDGRTVEARVTVRF